MPTVNPIDAIRAVVRTVGMREHEGLPVHVIAASRVYDANIEEVWNALTSAERIPRWFLPIRSDFRVGGRYQLKGNAGGTIQRCEPPRDLAVTWEYGGEASWVHVHLSPLPAERTELLLEHMSLAEGEFWEQFGPGATGIGWDLALMGFGTHLATGEAIDRAKVNAWYASEEGKGFMRESSEDWYRAAVVSGEDPGVARGQADRTLEAYLGEE